MADGLGRAEIGSDVDLTACVVCLDDPDDRELGEIAESRDTRHPFCAKSARSATKNRRCDANERVKIVQRIALRCLAGDDEASAQGVYRGVSGCV